MRRRSRRVSVMSCCTCSGLLRSNWLRRCRSNGLTDAADRVEEQPRVSPQRVDEDRRDTYGHRNHRPYRMNEAGRSERDAQAIKEECKGNVLDHLRVAPAADVAGNEKGAHTV